MELSKAIGQKVKQIHHSSCINWKCFSELSVARLRRLNRLRREGRLSFCKGEGEGEGFVLRASASRDLEPLTFILSPCPRGETNPPRSQPCSSAPKTHNEENSRWLTSGRAHPFRSGCLSFPRHYSTTDNQRTLAVSIVEAEIFPHAAFPYALLIA
jgi:hypothetical protein